MILYTSDGSFYEGMDVATITSLRSDLGKATTFISEVQYAAFLIANQPVPLTPAQIIALFRAQAIDLLQVDTSPNSKFVRAILLTLLDEINLIRSLLPIAQVARTTVQLRNAISAKINAGTAD